MLTRPPIVAIMGHVDHGKTTLLDFIRKTNVAGREAGGITQSIGAYEIIHNNKKITFIDTPGHEAFSKMRAHGAKIADLAILVVAADDGVKPQTLDALKCIRHEEIPFIVAINKIDKNNADIQKTKNDLLQNEVLLESLGGNISWQTISAKTGEGVNELLDLVLLASELENLTYKPGNITSGIILSSRLDPRRGILVGGVLHDGKLEVGQVIATATAKGKIKSALDFLGNSVKTLEPSAPVLITGFDNLPEGGEEFFADKNTEKIEQNLKDIKTPEKIDVVTQTQEKSSDNKINIILKADERGSLEALKHLIQKIAAGIPFHIIENSIGDIYENDVKLARASKSFIVGFKIKINKAAQNMAMAQNITIINSPVIYELEKELEKYAGAALGGEKRTIEILAVFGQPKGEEQIVGGKVKLGPIKNQEKFEIWNSKEKIGEGRILNLQTGKKDVSQTETENEVGLLTESKIQIKPSHKLLFN